MPGISVRNNVAHEQVERVPEISTEFLNILGVPWGLLVQESNTVCRRSQLSLSHALTTRTTVTDELGM